MRLFPCAVFVAASLLSGMVTPAMAQDQATPLSTTTQPALTPRAVADALLKRTDVWASREARQDVAIVLGAAADQGLNPDDYFATDIARLMALSDPSDADKATLDRKLTEGLLRYAADVRIGRVNPRNLKSEEAETVQRIDPAARVTAIAAAQDQATRQKLLAELAPSYPTYQKLVQALAALRKVQAAGGWQFVPDGPKMESGKSYAATPLLRKRLAASGELGEAAEKGEVYDSALVKAVTAYQKRHGLDADGVVGAKTRVHLNIPVVDRITAVIANMERLRWLPDMLGTRYVAVNLPAFHLIAVDNGTTALSMDVIVGRPARPTPSFSDTIRMVEFNPDWSVPPTIAREDVLPHLRTDPNYALEHKNVHIFKDGVEIDPHTVDWNTANIRAYRLTAPPGPANPLGTVKFLFPNPYDVYLHDTNERDKFALTVRALSSGCVRISKPYDMADWILGTDKAAGEWSAEKRQALLDSLKKKRFILNNPIPVYLMYHTVSTEEATGLPVFYVDLYGRDAAMAAELAKLPSPAARLDRALARISRAPAPEPIVTVSEDEKAAP